MKLIHTKIILFLIILIVANTGCKKFLEIDPPTTQLVSSTIFENDETANSAMLAVYAQMFNNPDANPLWIASLSGLAGDELTNNDITLTAVYINKINPATSVKSSDFWFRAYKLIYYANSVIEGCEKSNKLTPVLKQQLIGEALLIRAYWHLYLVNLFGDTPLALSTDYQQNSKISRKPTMSVYEQIITDLNNAKLNLSDNYLAMDGISVLNGRVRPNKSVADALLARVYLYTGKYALAESMASSLISASSKFELMPIDQVFLKESKEAIWQLMPQNNSPLNTHEGAGFIPLSSPVSEAKPSISSQLLNAFEPGDLRGTRWVSSITVGGKIYSYPFKYKVRISSNYTEYSVLLRLAEQYLIRAEARNELGNLAGAIADVNVIRSRARAVATVSVPNPLPPIPSGATKDQIKNYIIKERQIELFTEQGHRWIDLKRLKLVDNVMQAVSPTKGGETWNSNKQLWPLPQTDIFANPQLTQNPGYN